MLRLRSVLAVVCALIPASLLAQDPPAPVQAPAAPMVREIRVTGARELPANAVVGATSLRSGDAFALTPAQVSERVTRFYRREGYTFARVASGFDELTGALTITVDEGVIGAVEFDGIDDRLADVFAKDFALRPGDVFNIVRARQALNALLRPTRGAVTPSRTMGDTATVFHDTRELRARRPTFDLVDQDGQQILHIGLREPAGRFRVAPNLGKREDWFTPVDGFVPALDFGAVRFEHGRFNHTFVGGHLSVKTASGNIGYALGAERPFLAARKLFVGGELYDLTATDDAWQVSSTEASLAAVGPRRSFRDYYRRRGGQVYGALRIDPRVELFAALRGERHQALATSTDFSVWNDDEAFRSNRLAQAGQLRAFVVGASVDSLTFERESLDRTYQRHHFETPFGGRLADPAGKRDPLSMWRIDWTSEISTADVLSSDFNFRRHIVSGRARAIASRHQEVAIRAIAGWSDGELPPQREFSIGGIGSVHGYDFKARIGDALQLVNVEYAVGWPDGLQLLAFVDAGRTPRTRTAFSGAVAGSPWLKGAGWGVGLGPFRVDFGYPIGSSSHPLQVLLRIGRTF